MLNSALFVIALLAQIGQIQIPEPVGFVNDFAHVINDDMARRLEAIAKDVRAKSGGEIVVVTLPDLKGRDPSEVALAIGRQWKVGTKGGPGDRARNAGVVILVVPKATSSDKRGYVRIEVGTGAEGFITDATAGQIQDEAIPALQRADYAGALGLMTWRVGERFAREFQFAMDSSAGFVYEPPAPRQPKGERIPSFFFIVLIVVIVSLLSGRRRRGGCGGGGMLPIVLNIASSSMRHGGRGGCGGGGFGGFGGGGGFSGGGSGRSF